MLISVLVSMLVGCKGVDGGEAMLVGGKIGGRLLVEGDA